MAFGSQLVLLLAVCAWRAGGAAEQEESSNVVVVTSANFDLVFTGEWMLEFYAPWCPACKQFAAVWERFGKWAATAAEEEREEGGRGPVRVGMVDVTSETMLSGQFMVTHLPTVFHIIDGEARQYTESRTETKLIQYVEERLWEGTEPVSWWRSPTAKHMRAIGAIFWLSEKAKELQNTLEEEYQMPTYAVFIAIAVATIVIGLVLGGLTVCLIEVCMRCFSKKQEAPPPPPPAASPRQPQPAKDEPKPKDEDKKTKSPDRKARKRAAKAKNPSVKK